MKTKIKTFFGWLFLTDAYLASLTDEQVAIRALGRRKLYQFESQMRESQRRIQAHIDALQNRTW